LFSFDSFIIHFLNQYSRQSETIDFFIRFISGNHLIKGGVLLLLFWWAWYKESDKQDHHRAQLISTLFSCFIAIIIARGLALLLPFRLRPLHDSDLILTLPYGMKPTLLEGWSSLPSDHAVLFYTLSTGLFIVSRRAGLFALVYTTLFIALPRIYLGLHFLTDILAGALVGIAVALACNSSLFTSRVSTPVLNWSYTQPQFFYPLFFLLCYQIADMFDSARAIIGFLATLYKTI
jgi:undecaprenyl-diphosphatase